jgi:hypothetical protein
MNIDIVTIAFSRKLYGISGTIKDRQAWESGRILMDRMWAEIRANKFANQGMNHWVYEALNKIFVGVELDQDPPSATILERKLVNLPKYAYWKHVGPYGQLPGAYQDIRAELASRGLEESSSSIEIYGHDRGPNALPEIEILIGLK